MGLPLHVHGIPIAHMATSLRTNRRGARRPLTVTGAALASVVAAALGLVLAVTGPDRAGALDEGVLFGAFAQARGGETSQQAVEALEAELGVTLPIVRSFNRFDTPLDNNFHRWITRDDRTVLASVSTKMAGGAELTWRQIADAPPGPLAPERRRRRRAPGHRGPR